MSGSGVSYNQGRINTLKLPFREAHLDLRSSNLRHVSPKNVSGAVKWAKTVWFSALWSTVVRRWIIWISKYVAPDDIFSALTVWIRERSLKSPVKDSIIESVGFNDLFGCEHIEAVKVSVLVSGVGCYIGDRLAPNLNVDEISARPKFFHGFNTSCTAGSDIALGLGSGGSKKQSNFGPQQEFCGMTGDTPGQKRVSTLWAHGITDVGFLPLVESCEAGLVKVNLSGCVNLNDKVVYNCQLLDDLDVSKCAISDSGIASLARSNQINLQILSVSGCSKVSDKSFPFVGILGETLVGLNLQHCKVISSSAVDLLVEQLWRCDILL
ncbi:hypothetical protein F3Y22_tig00111758pilonHSYRG00357 [Hibiscus syriacus]|uniref:Uncharacterized protein n=1 Tax=Hibiscus syriacus TaxID=106335 RepID=A0A6A2YAB8_HIBSY|nr:hypothetical protein F3Y22_tig00111758pilonHSYRG00357 [Hibiscus syriacus]